MEENRVRGKDAAEPPPFLRTWGRVYAALLVYLLALIALFWLFQRRFTP
jgi:ABC-type glycerol-3-phosphate transport system permease component